MEKGCETLDHERWTGYVYSGARHDGVESPGRRERFALMPLSGRPHIDIDILPERRAGPLGNSDCSVCLADDAKTVKLHCARVTGYPEACFRPLASRP